MKRRFFLLDFLRRLTGLAGTVQPTAADLITFEYQGFSLDFLSDTYATRRLTSAEDLLIFDNTGFALDFTNNTYAVRTL